ncbi:Pr6Pr family membrane protein [Mucilaginibacter sp. FT3.2]|uniref:Pr6Pr family membrane protein n=1 Tax=Mucilaginibacter sp. FT3.2 TaxID=2723090 RepID=UPI00160C35AA|nr:Pr6Pr family membrane protein [Mucilaginibacter sp. FT3.2]MBB6233212.1 Co/Zn/Cd efflux system component [Mucilaginibacter sp. FT3.2]
MQKPGKTGTICAIVLALIVWFSIILQFIISTNAYLQEGRTFGGAIVQIISFFTILSNILVGCCLLAIVLKPASAFQKFFAANSVVTATALYITIVGLVYNTVLRSLWVPPGLFALTNELTHLFNPIAFIVFWLIFVPKEKLNLSQALSWLWFPLLYLVYALIRGALYRLYPYPFLNVDKLGYQSVLINSFFVMIAFLIFDAIFFLLNNWLAGKRK